MLVFEVEFSLSVSLTVVLAIQAALLDDFDGIWHGQGTQEA